MGRVCGGTVQTTRSQKISMGKKHGGGGGALNKALGTFQGAKVIVQKGERRERKPGRKGGGGMLSTTGVSPEGRE